MVGTGAVESARGKANHLGVFVDVLRYNKRFRGFYRRSEDKVNNVDKVECRCILKP